MKKEILIQAAPETVLRQKIRRKYRAATKEFGTALPGWSEAKPLIDRIFDKKTPYFELSVVELFRVAGKVSIFNDKWSEIEKMINAVLFNRGYRESADFTTIQEHRLAGGTPPGNNFEAENKYVPVGVLNGKLTINEAQRARELAAVMRICRVAYADNPLESIASLEPLDGNGMTMRDPRLLDRKILTEDLKKGVLLLDAYEHAAIVATKTEYFWYSRD
ncbi:MAG: hypothetical protein NT051_02370 [Candidatus Micrarchaeota archaeon]|nr:hypothetical protein [Candidatus Micrarchaeota archaeon]